MMPSKSAAYFEIGDVILWGKYKNKKGKIVSFGKDEKGQPTVEIEPVPKGQKQNKTMTLFKIRKGDPDKTAANIVSLYCQKHAAPWGSMENPDMTSTPTAISSRVAARYLKAYAEREGKQVLHVYEQLVKTTEVLTRNHAFYERAPKDSEVKADAVDSVRSQLDLSLALAEQLVINLNGFFKKYQPVTEYKKRNFDTLQKQWALWRRDIDAFTTSATKYLKAADPEGYFWPVNLVEQMIIVASTVAHGAYQLTMPDLKGPEVDPKANKLDELRAFATGKAVGIARKVVQDLGRDKKSVANFVYALLEDTNLTTVSQGMGGALGATGNDEQAGDLAVHVGRMISWDAKFAIGVSYAALKAVGDPSKAEVLLAEAANFMKKLDSKRRRPAHS
jgi:hypothetical protein